MISSVFIERPRFAMVVSIVITLAGLLALLSIPVTQYPKITPPTVRVSASYSGASAEVVADNVGAPIEAAVNGVEDMLYMSSSSTDNGSYSLSITFEVGTDPNIAQVNVQNRLQQAASKLPEEVTRQGVTVRTMSSDRLLMLSFFSPGGTYDPLFISNYASINVRDALARVDGVSDATILGALDYSMRVWMDPERMTALGLTTSDVISAIESQNIQATAGSIGTAPAGGDQQVQYTLRAKGRLKDVAEFEDIIVRTNAEGAVVRLRDIAEVELGAQSYTSSSEFNGGPSITMSIDQSAGANALETVAAVRAELDRLAKRFPPDLEYFVIHDATRFVRATIQEIVATLFTTFVVVVLVTFLFLQDWRATLIPSLTIPVSLIGSFAVLMLLGYSANTITLFALILAIGLVVDDALVVVENTQRIMQDEGLDPKSAAHRAMSQVTGPIVATTLVLLAVFVPVGFLPGITGELYRQFAVTITVAVVLSSFNALTLSPALCATLLRAPRLPRRGPLSWFSRGLEGSRDGYAAAAAWLAHRATMVLVLFVLVFAACYGLYRALPTSFIPKEDQGTIFVDVQLPESAALPRTRAVMSEISRRLRELPGVSHANAISGYSMIGGSGENVGMVIVQLEDWDERTAPQVQIEPILGNVRRALAAIPGANANAFAPPAIRGLGVTGGFDFQLQALGGQDPRELASVMRSLVVDARQDPAVDAVFSTYSADVPQLFVDIDRTKAKSLNVPIREIFTTLQAQLGSRYVNDFTIYSRLYQVKIQADARYRTKIGDIGALHVRSDDGKMVPLSTLVSVSAVIGPQLVPRYNQFTAAKINGAAAPGFSSGEAMTAMERVADATLPEGYGYEWSGMSLQERKSGGQAPILILLALLFAYLFLVGQYESWTIPLPVMISVSVAVLGALGGLWLSGLENNIYAQIGLILLVGLASKNAILIVEFSRTRREAGASVFEAAVTGARQRYRAVLMTACSFILGVLPLVIASGAGANSRRAIGTTVFSGMLAATLIGIFLIPALYVVFQSMRENVRRKG